MGLGYCKQCKDDCCHTEIQIPDKRLLHSQSSVFRDFKNPFFPKDVDLNEFIFDDKNRKSFVIDDIEEMRLKTEKEDEEKRKKEEEEEKKKKEEEEEKKKKEEEEEKKKKEEEEEKRKKEELNKLKNEILEKEKKDRMNINNNKIQEIINNENNNIININDNNSNINNENTMLIQKEKEENAKINSTLENMCIIGDITKKEIQEEKMNNPEKFIETSEALNLKDEDDAFFALGLLSQNLQDIGVETAIEKVTNDDDDEQDAAATCLQYITNGLAEKKKYDLHFEFGEERNDELLKDKNEFEEFKKNLKKKLSKDYHVPEDKIIVTFPQKGSFHVQVIFQSDEFNDLDTEEFKQKFIDDDEFEELKNLKEIHSDVILGGCKLSKKLLDERGNRTEGWGVNEKRGGRNYNPPIGWIGIGLRVLDKYENNDWVAFDGNKNEWCVAYHGVGRFSDSEGVKDITGKIIKGTFKVGQNQVHKNCENINKPGTKVGEGVYCTPNVDTACAYSGVSKINGKQYQTVLMVRVKPGAIRECTDSGDYWVVNGTTDEIRPYRILYKCS